MDIQRSEPVALALGTTGVDLGAERHGDAEPVVVLAADAESGWAHWAMSPADARRLARELAAVADAAERL
jgi:hypothetical protein